MTTIRLQVAPRVGPANPRGARLGAAVFVALWRALEWLGRRATPTAKSAAEEAQAVREMAHGWRQADPRFAAELYAAADRHERVHGAG